MAGLDIMKYKFPKHIVDPNSKKVQDIFNRIKELEDKGENVINLAFGLPIFETPEPIRFAAREAIMRSKSKIPNYEGVDKLKIEVCNYIDRTRGFRPKIEQIIITQGIKITLFNILQSLLIRNEEIVLTDPGFSIYSSLARVLGVKIKYIPRDEKKNFKINLSDLDEIITEKTKIILINTPHNPTGNVLTNSELQQLYEVAEKNNSIILSDETFSQIIFEGNHTSPGAIDRTQNRTMIIEDISYTFSMSGWGLGYCLGPEEIINRLRTVFFETTQMVPEFIQYAGIKALSESITILPELLEKFKKCCSAMVSGLNELPGFSCSKPNGGVFAFPDISGTGKSGQELTDELLNEAAIAVLPGEIFGKHGANHIRISFATEKVNINEGLIRLQELF